MRASTALSVFPRWPTQRPNRRWALTFSSAAPRSHARPPPAGCPSGGPPTSWESNCTVDVHTAAGSTSADAVRFTEPDCVFVGDLSASDTSLVDLVERHRGPLPQELMPLPSSDRDSPLDWTHLVDVASTFDSERNTHYGTIQSQDQ